MKMSQLEKAIESIESEIAVLVAAKARLLQQRNATATKRSKGPKAVAAEKASA